MIVNVKRVLLVLSVNEDKPVYVEEAAESTGRQWINDLPNPRNNPDYSLTLVWQGRYRSDSHYEDVWRKPVKPWSPGNVRCTKSNNCVDDTTYGDNQ